MFSVLFEMHNFVARHKITKTNAAQRYETKVAAIQNAPLLPAAEEYRTEENVSKEKNMGGVNSLKIIF